MKIFKNKTIFLIVSIVIILAIVILFLSYKNRPIVIDEDVCVKDLFSRLYSKSTISSDGILSASVEMMDDKESIVIKNIKENKILKTLESHLSDNTEANLSGFSSLNFSSEGDKLYFTSNAWTTNYAIHELDINTGIEKFLISGGPFLIIPFGEYVGKLVFSFHDYFLAGGSYDWWWIMDLKTGEIDKDNPIGDDLNNFFDLICPNSVDK